jgi:hypothetical protein
MTRRAKIGAVQLDVLDSMAAGARDLPALVEHTGRPYWSVYAALRALVTRGLVCRTREREYGGLRGSGPGAYAVTPYGRVEMLRALRAGRVPGVACRPRGR